MASTFKSRETVVNNLQKYSACVGLLGEQLNLCIHVRSSLSVDAAENLV